MIHSLHRHFPVYKTFLLTERLLSQNTIQAYERDILDFIHFQGERPVHQHSLNLYNRELSLQGLKAKTINRKLSSIMGFLNFLSSENILPKKLIGTVTRPKPEKTLPRRLPKDLLSHLFDKMLYRHSRFPNRDIAIMELLFSSGIRISELIQLEFKHFDSGYKGIHVHGKGHKERWVPLGKPAITSLKTYVNTDYKALEKETRSFVFLTQRGTAFSRQGMYSLIKLYLRLLKENTTLSPHSFRHTYATELVNNHADLRLVQELLGHSSISSTEIYTKVSLDHKKSVYNKAHPRS